MNLRIKSISILIIALLVGLTFSPVSSTEVIEKKKNHIPINISIFQKDGTTISETLELTKNDIDILEKFIQTIQNAKDKIEISQKMREFITLYNAGFLGTLFSFDWIENLPGHPIISFGKGMKFLTRYHGRLQLKKLFSTWSYPNSFSSTIIWGNGISSPPTQILLKRQIGFMVGFIGVYVYIPPFVSGMNSRTIFIGSSLFAWGASI